MFDEAEAVTDPVAADQLDRFREGQPALLLQADLQLVAGQLAREHVQIEAGAGGHRQHFREEVAAHLEQDHDRARDQHRLRFAQQRHDQREHHELHDVGNAARRLQETCIGAQEEERGEPVPLLERTVNRVLHEIDFLVQHRDVEVLQRILERQESRDRDITERQRPLARPCAVVTADQIERRHHEHEFHDLLGRLEVRIAGQERRRQRGADEQREGPDFPCADGDPAPHQQHRQHEHREQLAELRAADLQELDRVQQQQHEQHGIREIEARARRGRRRTGRRRVLPRHLPDEAVHAAFLALRNAISIDTVCRAA